MGKLRLMTALSFALAACTPAATPPAPRDDNGTQSTAPVIACNALRPNTQRLIFVQAPPTLAESAADLRGGPIAPGVYDLVSATRIGAATGWSGARAVALEVSESEDGAVVLNWAGVSPGAATDTWTAALTQSVEPRLRFTCGRIGDVPAAFAASSGALDLELQDGATGRLAMHFEVRP